MFKIFIASIRWRIVALILPVFFASSMLLAEPEVKQNLSNTRPDIKTVIVALNHAPPFRIFGQNGEISGLYVEIFDAMLARLNWRALYVEMPFRRALKNLEIGEAEVMLGPNWSKEREVYIDFSIPAYSAENRLFVVRDDRPLIRQYQDLESKQIGVLRGSVYFKRFDKDSTLLKEQGVNSSETRV